MVEKNPYKTVLNSPNGLSPETARFKKVSQVDGGLSSQPPRPHSNSGIHLERHYDGKHCFCSSKYQSNYLRRNGNAS